MIAQAIGVQVKDDTDVLVLLQYSAHGAQEPSFAKGTGLYSPPICIHLLLFLLRIPLVEQMSDQCVADTITAQPSLTASSSAILPAFRCELL